MRILLLHYSAAPVVGGVESVMGQQAHLMARAGHEVQIAAGRGEQVDEEVEFIPIYLADSRHPEIMAAKKQLDAGKVPPEFLALVSRLYHALQDAFKGIDCVIAHNVCSLNKNLALTAALHQISQESGGPHLVLWHHDMAWTTPRYRAELNDDYPWNLLRTAWPGVRQVTISQFRRRELAELFGISGNDIRVVPNGVDLVTFFKLGEQASQLTRRLDLLKAWPLLLLPVRITPRKNIELGLQVLARLKQLYPEAELVVTGPPGPHNPANAVYLQRLKDLRLELDLESSAHFLTEVLGATLHDEAISDLFRLADALFLPSREEGFGIPILEAGLARLPVFCSDIPPLRELGDEYVDYFRLDEDPGEIAAMMARRLDESRLLGMRRRVGSSYTWAKVYEQHIAPLLEGA
jgi:glycosyltransferase involved in cell wall biosynthesis